MTTKRDTESIKIHKNYNLKSTPEKDHEKVLNWDPPGPQKVRFRARGHQFPQIPPPPQKTPKSHQKGDQNDPEMEPVEQKVRIENSTPEIDPKKSENRAKVGPKNRVRNQVPPKPPS